MTGVLAMMWFNKARELRKKRLALRQAARPKLQGANPKKPSTVQVKKASIIAAKSNQADLLAAAKKLADSTKGLKEAAQAALREKVPAASEMTVWQSNAIYESKDDLKEADKYFDEAFKILAEAAARGSPADVKKASVVVRKAAEDLADETQDHRAALLAGIQNAKLRPKSQQKALAKKKTNGDFQSIAKQAAAKRGGLKKAAKPCWQWSKAECTQKYNPQNGKQCRWNATGDKCY